MLAPIALGEASGASPGSFGRRTQRGFPAPGGPRLHDLAARCSRSATASRRRLAAAAPCFSSTADRGSVTALAHKQAAPPGPSPHPQSAAQPPPPAPASGAPLLTVAGMLEPMLVSCFETYAA